MTSVPMKKVQLVFIPVPGIGHVVSITQFAKSLLDRDDRLSVTILVIRPSGADPQLPSLPSLDARIKCINIPPPLVPPPSSAKCSEKFISDYIEGHKSHVENAIITEVLSDDSVQLAGIVVDLFCSSMIELAHQFKVPSYLFFTSSAAFLGFMLHLPVHHDRVGTEFHLSDVDSVVDSYANPVPANVLPSLSLDKGGYNSFLDHGTRYKETKGYIINTFAELEPHAIGSLLKTPPPIYAVGPLLDINKKEESEKLVSKRDEIMTWLDEQPPSTVVFLCFGSKGSFEAPQLEQIAMALELSGQRFLWSIRRPPPKDQSFQMPTEYENIHDVLPEGFLERTKNRGMVCGWAPQVEILAHRATGGFVSHCGWNSSLESLWYGVPMATWPLYAEQQLNAFELVRELGLAVELKLDYRVGSGEVVMADVIERAVSRLMDKDEPVRSKVKAVSEQSRKAVVDGGSSFASFEQFTEDFLGNIQAFDA